jgi:hypothetical protein
MPPYSKAALEIIFWELKRAEIYIFRFRFSLLTILLTLSFVLNAHEHASLVH